MELRIPLAEPPISEDEIAFIRDEIVGTAPPQAKLHHLAEACIVLCLGKWGEQVLMQGGIVTSLQMQDFGRRIWCYQHIAMQLHAERTAIDFPEHDPSDIMGALVKASAKSDFGEI